MIWIEFTKTTTDHNGSGSLGRAPLDDNDGYWEVRDFVERAARPIQGLGASVPIRSSISKVRDEAESAADSAKTAKRWTQGIGIAAAVAATTGVVALALGLFVFIQDAYNSLSPRVDDLEERLFSIEKITASAGSENLPSAIRDLTRQHEELREKVGDIERMVTDRETDAP